MHFEVAFQADFVGQGLPAQLASLRHPVLSVPLITDRADAVPNMDLKSQRVSSKVDNLTTALALGTLNPGMFR